MTLPVPLPVLMVKPYRWVVTGVSPHLVRRVRALAVLRGMTVPAMVDEVLQSYLDRQREDLTESTSPRSRNPTTGDDQGPARPAAENAARV
jgi:hypothetical protein